ncbi:MAG: transcriptional regulator [Methylococcales symbiont of Hymedesmia sp. n. MRB-2018]|nr:MAG: transcriptional regulator [Methylococcales symbiont of Hymedesmia sp. n. MRB-2018]KAF3983209.1 MAG: transcriptional regulator [Methylococcales symbiont of Hymedesmia sp. n. MRB-2018]
MQLTVVALGNKTTHFIVEILTAVSSCRCHVVELRSSHLAQTTASYLLIEGEWNHIAKLESILDTLQKKLEITIKTLRAEANSVISGSIPYVLETISVDRNDIIKSITCFLLERDLDIEEINASCYQAPYIQTPIFSTKFILLIPPEVRLLALREEFLDFCDQLNIDAIIEPIKR